MTVSRLSLSRSAACLLALSALSACGALAPSAATPPGAATPPALSPLSRAWQWIQPYRVEVVQGNVVTQEVMSQIQPGLGRNQVREILGTPLLADPFHASRWDYVFTIHRQGVADQERKVAIFFKDDVVDHFEADPLPSEHEFVASIDKPMSGSAPKLELSPKEVAGLPVPAPQVSTVQAPQGAVRSYPPLESGQR